MNAQLNIFQIHEMIFEDTSRVTLPCTQCVVCMSYEVATQQIKAYFLCEF